MKFYPYEKGGGNSFSHAEGEHKRFWGSFYAGACFTFSHIEVGRWGGGAQNGSDPRFPNFVAPPPPLPVINDQSLTIQGGGGDDVVQLPFT